MKTLDYRTSRTIESTRLQMEDGCNGVEQVIFFNITEDYNHYTDGTVDLFKRTYAKQDGRQYVNQGDFHRHYKTEKGYRNAIKRWSKKAVTVE
jgi:hypothetical protein